MGGPKRLRGIGEQPPDDWYPDADPPPPEFDRDAMDALAIPGLAEDERDRIMGEARELARRGMPREQVGNWMLRAVTQSLVAPTIWPYDKNGNLVDPPYVTEAVALNARKRGAKRQARRNEIVGQWVARCRQLMEKNGLNQREVIKLAYQANTVLTKAARGERALIPLDRRFEDLKPLHGQKKLSTLTKVRFRKRISAGLKGKATIPGQ
jgi:hypothetical protein